MIIKNITKNFQIDGTLIFYESFGAGHINDTYALTYKINDNDTERYILQKLNKNVFPDIDILMENMVNVTEFIQKKLLDRNEDVKNKCINIIKTKDNRNYYIDEFEDNWRMTRLIENTKALDVVVDTDLFEKTGKAFGEFINILDDYPANTLNEVIADFHNTVARYIQLEKAIKCDTSNRRANCQDLIDFAIEHRHLCSIIINKLIKGEIPIRVTHNDTKINNILISRDTNEAVCVIDLDTIMPGSLLYDFGDSIRSGCNTALEDETNLQLVDFDIAMFEAYVKGFLEGLGTCITKEEKKLLAISAVIITYECGMRFLADYLNGNVYFKITYPEHNLVRCRTQFKLVQIMLSRLEEMQNIVNKY